MNEPDYTEIQDDEIRTTVCSLMSEMLDNPNEHGIYPTAKFMWRMERFIIELIYKNRQEVIDNLVKLSQELENKNE